MVKLQYKHDGDHHTRTSKPPYHFTNTKLIKLFHKVFVIDDIQIYSLYFKVYFVFNY